MKKTALLLIFIMVLSSALPCITVSADTKGADREQLLAVAKGIIEWKSKSISDNGTSLLEKLSSLSGSTAADWYAFSLGRLSIFDGAKTYTDHLKLYVERKYTETDKLSNHLSTEWHRIALTALALGEDARSFGNDSNGSAIDLIRDGIYDRGLTASLGAQGINGYIWALIALDSERYEVPNNAHTKREDIIKAILEYQLSDGGFALSGKVSDPDVTAMAITALSPYINDNTVYSYTQKATEEAREIRVFEVIDSAVSALAGMQTDDGEFRSYGSKNVKSACQVVVALCSVGIDIFSDSRFIKSGETILDVIMRYRNEDGGFVNLSGDGKASNSMSGEQVMYALCALIRFSEEERKLFDMRAEFNDELKERIVTLNKDISYLSASSGVEEIEETLRDYFSLPKKERDYIYAYRSLEGLAKINRLDIDKIESETKENPGTENPDNTNKDNEDDEVILTDEEKTFILSLEDVSSLTTEFYNRILILQKKNAQTKESTEKEKYTQTLSRAITHIEAILKEIDLINKAIANEAHPLDGVDASKKDILSSLVERYESLSEYDRGKISDAEGLYAAYARANTEKREGVLLYASVGAIITLLAFILLSVRARRIKKKKEEEEEEEEA